MLLGAVLWPVRQNWRAQPCDGFPLSYYPMFSVRRRRRCKVTHVVGIRPGGERVVIPYRYAGLGGLNQVRRQLRRVALEGEPVEFCRAVATGIDRRRDPELAGLAAVELVTGSYDLEEFFRGDREPAARRVHGRHEIEGLR